MIKTKAQTIRNRAFWISVSTLLSIVSVLGPIIQFKLGYKWEPEIATLQILISPFAMMGVMSFLSWMMQIIDATSDRDGQLSPEYATSRLNLIFRVFHQIVMVAVLFAAKTIFWQAPDLGFKIGALLAFLSTIFAQIDVAIATTDWQDCSDENVGNPQWYVTVIWFFAPYAVAAFTYFVVNLF